VAAVQAYEEDGLIDNAAKVGPYLGKRLAELKEDHLSVGDVRQIGLFSVIEVVKDKSTKEPMATRNAKAEELKTMNEIGAYLRENGLFTFIKANMIFIAPPLCITEDQIDDGLSIIKGALSISDQVTAA
jgi:taurine--2-oxoglutarate transaminase